MSESNMEYQNSTIEDTLCYDKIKSKLTRQEIISHDVLNDNKDKIDEILPTVDDPDALFLHEEGSIDFDETIGKISEMNESESPNGEKDQKNFEANKYINIQIKSEPLDDTYDNDFQNKQETNNEFHIPNKGILGHSKLKTLDEKLVIVKTNEHLADKGITEITVKTEPCSTDIGESKFNIDDKIQSSNEAIIYDTMNENKKSEKIAPTSTKYMAKNIFFDKDGLMKIVKTEQHVASSVESTKNIDDKSSNKIILTDPRIKTIKSEQNELIYNINKPSTSNDKTTIEINFGSPSTHDVSNITYDYFEEEKEDLFDPGWNKVKELSTDEERYRQVKECWESEDIPNPIKNLTSYSYRKRQIKRRGMSHRQRRQHKRHASNELNEESAKHSRSCTFIFDHRIKSIEKKKRKEAKTIQKEMFDEISQVHEQHYQQEMGVQNRYGFISSPQKQFELRSLARDYQQRVASVSAKYGQKVNECCNQYLSEIDSLKKNRNEVMQFHSFYKGLNKNEIKDPTVLTNAEAHALGEIENIYKTMDLCYK